MRGLLCLWLILLPSSVLANTAWQHPLEDLAIPQVGPKPAFKEMVDVAKKKAAFFGYLTPQVHAANERIVRDRAQLLLLEDSLIAGNLPTPAQAQLVNKLSRRYKLNAEGTSISLERLQALLARVDILPISLVLAQAANESGWGTSRFAIDANNYFGMWCYQKGCGLRPLHRDAGRNHEVKAFDTVFENIEAYLLNINTHRAYLPLRDLRQTLRDLDAPLRGVLLAEGLVAYSSRGEAYVSDIQQLITANDLEQLQIELVSN